MTRFAPVAVLAMTVCLAVSASASAAWFKPGKCRVPAGQARYFPTVADRANNQVSTKKIPCVLAALAIDHMRDGGAPLGRRSFRHTVTGARWQAKMTCRTHLAPKSDAPQRGTIIRCRVRQGSDGETNRDRVRSLNGARIVWRTAYTSP